MKAETADTIYRELLRRSSADGLAYLREQLAAHEAKGYGLCAPIGPLKVEWTDDDRGGSETVLGGCIAVSILETYEIGCGSFYDAVLTTGKGYGVLRSWSGVDLDSTKRVVEKRLPKELANLVDIGRAAARALAARRHLAGL